MAIDIFQTLDVIEAMENFLERIRPRKEIRPELDYGYKIEGQSILIFEIRPRWNKPEIILEDPFAKTTFVKAKKYWKVFWMRANLKWYPYSPMPVVKTIHKFIKIVEEDEYHCFFG